MPIYTYRHPYSGEVVHSTKPMYELHEKRGAPAWVKLIVFSGVLALITCAVSLVLHFL